MELLSSVMVQGYSSDPTGHGRLRLHLGLHTAAYWLVRMVRDAVPKTEQLASGEFSTIQLRPLKSAVRVRETATRDQLAFAANCPDTALFQSLITTQADPSAGPCAPANPSSCNP